MPGSSSLFRRFLSRLVNLARSEYDLARLESEVCGEETRLGRGCQLIGPHAIRIGRHCVVGEYSWINANSHSAETSCIEIADYSLIGRRNFLSAGKAIRLGPYTLTGPDCHLICADHRISDPCAPYIASGAVLDDTITLGANCWLGTSVIVLGQVEIGRGSVIGSGAVVLKSLPPFSLAVGAPARLLKRFNFLANTWVDLADWTPEMEAALPSETDYLATLKTRQPHLTLPKLAAGAGIDRP